MYPIVTLLFHPQGLAVSFQGRFIDLALTFPKQFEFCLVGTHFLTSAGSLNTHNCQRRPRLNEGGWPEVKFSV